MKTKTNQTIFDGFPTDVKLFLEEDVVTTFHAVSLKDYKDQLFLIIEQNNLYHAFIDTYAVKGNRYNETLKPIESFIVAGKKLWEKRKNS